MLTLNQVQREILDLESQEFDYDAYMALAALYTIEDRIIEIEGLSEKQSKQETPLQGLDASHESLSKAEAERILSHVKNPDGMIGPHWTLDDAKKVMARNEVSGSPVDFWIAMCLLYAEYSDVAKDLGVNTMDFYVGMTKAFLNDENGVADKVRQYCQSVLKT